MTDPLIEAKEAARRAVGEQFRFLRPEMVLCIADTAAMAAITAYETALKDAGYVVVPPPIGIVT